MHNLREIFSEELFEQTAEALSHRGFDLTENDRETYYAIRAGETSIHETRAQLNILSKQFGKASEDERARLREQTSQLKGYVQEEESRLAVTRDQFELRMLGVPNISAAHVPTGESDKDNVVISEYGTIPGFPEDKPAVDHLTIGTRLGIIDNENAAMLSGSKFSVYRGKGARLKRALINFMLDAATSNGYQEVEVPYLVRPDVLQGTGQLPKFEDDMFQTVDNKGNALYLIPTTEVPLTNLMKNHVFKVDELPYKLTGYSENFRREAGKAGQDTKGLIRNHQFPKIELIQIAHPDHSWDSYNKMIDEASFVLNALSLPFRTIELCTGDLGFAALSTRDLEVWLPSQNRFLEVSSVSNTGEFQARRIGMKYVEPETGNRKFVHTLNGTAVAVGRTMAALIENNQNPDGSVSIPEALQDYTKFDKIES